jgi:tripartite-type tricarboxylate transporter receptor subunit TctC
MLRRICESILVIVIAAIIIVSIGGPVRAAWPERTITIIVHFAPGGSNDLLGRLLASELKPVLGQSLIVENRPGADGNIGLTAAARAAPDGYTLVVASGVVLINPSIGNAGYDPAKDFAPIAYLGASPNVILTRPASGITSIEDLIVKAKANPDRITYSSPGVGSISQLAVELLELRTKTKLIHVPFSGAAPAAQAAIAGTTDLGSVSIAGLIGFIQSGALRALVQTGKERWPDLPDVPTMEEAGIPNAVVETSQMLLAPAGTPEPIVDRLAKEVLIIMNKPDVRERMFKASFAVQPEGPDQLRERIAREVPMWKELVDRAGIKNQ